ncbi:uncharacterized protein METZ01_LOCUS34384 [marine metagenome]|uniref:Uncharacterized protein n=1 Tax=marine metagenome TaxID=408172 RepID=A0A381QR12_9ZZZZ
MQEFYISVGLHRFYVGAVAQVVEHRTENP